MTVVNQLQEIIKVYTEKNGSTALYQLNQAANEQGLKKIEELIEEPLPQEFLALLSFANGQAANSKDVLPGDRFLSSDEIIDQLLLSRSFVKPEHPYVENKERSDGLLKTIVDFYTKHAIKRNFLGIKQKWHKMKFACGVNSFDGPYLYTADNTSENEYEIVTIDSRLYETISQTVKTIYEAEKATYNWDKLEFVVYQDGTYEAKRTYYDFDKLIPFTSTPENAIRKKYFHYKWLPLFSDYGGNFIGFDLDPDINGVKGQIINFGRDEEDMFVLANNLQDFFELILSDISKPDSRLLNLQFHLHDTLKSMKKL